MAVVWVPITLFRRQLVNLFSHKGGLVGWKGKMQSEGGLMKISSRAWTGEKKFKYTKTKIHFATSGVLGFWSLGWLGQECLRAARRILFLQCLLVERRFEECAVCWDKGRRFCVPSCQGITAYCCYKPASLTLTVATCSGDLHMCLSFHYGKKRACPFNCLYTCMHVKVHRTVEVTTMTRV